MVFRALIVTVLLAAGLLAKTPASAPATRAASAPTAAEIIARFHEQRQKQDKTKKVAWFDLAGPVLEQPAPFSLFGAGNGTVLRDLLDRLDAARRDADIAAVLITLSETDLNLAQAQEIRDALVAIGRAGKQSFVYADAYDMTLYTLASGASHICMLEGGEVLMPGLSLEATFAKGLLDKLGVTADYIQIGEYKGASEQFTRTGPTEELRGELNKVLDALYGQLVGDIAVRRNLPPEKVRAVIDDALIDAQEAHERGLVDHLVDADSMEDLIADELGEEVQLVQRYAKSDRPGVDLSNPLSFFSLFAKRPAATTRPAIAVIHAEGLIVDGQGGVGMFDAAIGSEDLRGAFRHAADDPNIKGVVLRIDSPGGSALASEAMWQAARRLAQEKPLVVSIGATAASGGYYLACAGERIYADPSALVGSIGVVGGKLVLKDLYGKIGLGTESFSRGRNAGLFSSIEPFTDAQRQLVSGWMRKTYEQFTRRVMTTRADKIKNIDEVARGRIFIASQAVDLGMIDEIGGIRSALGFVAGRAELGTDYDVRSLPESKTLFDLLTGSRELHSPISTNLALLPGGRDLARHVQMLQLFERRPVVAVWPYQLRVR